MAQALWYLRHAGRVYGPFPAPQIKASLSVGDVTADWEISLNEIDWLTIAESGQFNADETPGSEDSGTDAPGWREERQRARQRWLGDSDGVESAVSRDPQADALIRQAISHDQARTDALVQAEKRKRASLLAPLLTILLLLSVGIGVWWGQGEKRLQAEISPVADCSAPSADGINWSNCDKRGLVQPALRARSARMERTRLDQARLSGADLTYSVLRGASLRNAQLSGSLLLGADLTDANLSGADLTGTDLRYAVLKNADLTGARLDSARLGNAVWIDGRTCEEGAPGQCR